MFSSRKTVQQVFKIHTAPPLHLSTSKFVIYRGNARPQESALVEEAMHEMNESLLREFTFNTDDEEMLWLVLLPVLKHSPLLERIALPCNADSLPNLARVFQVRSDHQLRHLDINATHHKSINGIREFFGLVGCDVRGLQPLQITDFSAVKPAIIAEYFFLSLCDLSLTPFIDIQTFSVILGRLPNLRSLEMKVHLDIDVGEETEALLQHRGHASD
ncbi:hypothetical protein BGZ49_008629 [Haplosporangium sp. Z 27]|nr:hypothetical protein BGZ49_008629 [Haplosporangium sp. Z 27]